MNWKVVNIVVVSSDLANMLSMGNNMKNMRVVYTIVLLCMTIGAGEGKILDYQQRKL